MVVKSVCRDSSDRESWDKIFKTLVKILRTKQDQLESLLKDRKTVESSFKTTLENWTYDVQNYEDQLSLMNREIERMKMIQFVETSKCNLLTGLKERDCSLCNLKLENTLDELNDFKAWFDLLTTNINMQKGSGNTEATDIKSLETEIRKLKLEYEKLASEKKCELKRKDDEIAQANTKISSLISYQEQLQSSNHEKDEIISRLKAKTTSNNGFTKKDEEISKLRQDLESLKKSRKLTRDNDSNDNNVGSHISTKKEKSVAPTTPNEKEMESSKRKRSSKTPVIVSEIPKLFSSTFTVPKLKSQSSGDI